MLKHNLKGSEKRFAKRIVKARQSFSVLGEMLIIQEIEIASLPFLSLVQGELKAMGQKPYAELESEVLKRVNAEWNSMAVNLAAL